MSATGQGPLGLRLGTCPADDDRADRHQDQAALLQPWQPMAQRLDRRPVGVTDRHGMPLAFGDALDLGEAIENSIRAWLVVEKYVASRVRYALPASLVGRDRSWRGEGVDEQQLPSVQLAHDPLHAVAVGGEARPHVVVDADESGKTQEMGAQSGHQLMSPEAGQQRAGTRPFLPDRFHGDMQQQLVAGGTCALGLLRQRRRVWQERQGQWRWETVEGGRALSIDPEVVDHDGDCRAPVQAINGSRIAQPSRQGPTSSDRLLIELRNGLPNDCELRRATADQPRHAPHPSSTVGTGEAA